MPKESLSSALFPGLSSSVQVHSGFANEHAKPASSILSAVQDTLSKFPQTTSITTVGHSLGAALSLLEAVHLQLNLPSGTTIRFIGYGTPRVGNPAFANYVDAQLPGSLLTRVNNKQDVVPTVPPQLLGFQHPSGEIHIQESNAWDACPGMIFILMYISFTN